MTTTATKIELIAHLMRRAGFGATRDELEAYAAQGYEATVDMLLDMDRPDGIQHDILRRYHPDHGGGLGMGGITANWVHRMINSRNPLQEKVALFWHGVFATGYAKLTQGRVLMDHIQMFRNHGVGDLKTLLIELSRDPAMIVWLDNYDNHNGAINENFGRELLELFSMGVGNYSEDDIKEASRAFTGWTIGNTEYSLMRARNDSLWPYGRLNLHFEYRPDDHDNGVKRFLSESGNFNGEDIVDIICKQEATARFIARHMYTFFVADEPPVPKWPYDSPRDPEAIEVLTDAYFDSGYNIKAMLRALFLSDFFQSEDCWYEKVKGPTELVVGVLRLTGDHRKPSPKLQKSAGNIGVMGQTLINPPSVEGWHWGEEWIDTGNLVERINFAATNLGDPSKPGVREMIDRLVTATGGVATPDGLVDACLDQLGAIRISPETRSLLVAHAAQSGNVQFAGNGASDSARKRVAEMFQLIAATPEFQRE